MLNRGTGLANLSIMYSVIRREARALTRRFHQSQILGKLRKETKSLDFVFGYNVTRITNSSLPITEMNKRCPR